MSAGDSFLGRWSARKRGAIDDEPAVAETPEPADRPDDEVLAELDLPEPETLGAGDDFSRFMGEAVPARLRNRALRRLWLTNPALANLDELLDYGEDFTDAATVVENLQTAYQAGKGFLRDVAEETEPPNPATAPDEQEPEEAAPDDMADTPSELEETVPEEPMPVLAMTDAEGEALPAPRRMRFRFDDV